MRTASTSNLINTPTTTATIILAPTPPPTSTTIITTHHSLWNSPIPYLFGGLAAMFGLIAFALLILGFSYRTLMGQLQSQDGGRRDMEKGDPQKKESVKVYDEKLLVIMAGEEKPTFLATPVCPKSLSLDVGNGLDKEFGDREVCDKSEKEMHNNNHVVVGVGSTSTQENEACHEIQQQQLRYPLAVSIPAVSDNGIIPVSEQPTQQQSQ